MMKKIVTPVLLAGIIATSSGCAKEVIPVGAQEITPEVSQNVETILSQTGVSLETSDETTNQFLALDITDREYKNVWGEQNFLKMSSGNYKVLFPRGSYVASSSGVEGGAGFIAPLESLGTVSGTSKTLEYKITFGPNFDFVKGGKLPGLCGGSCPRGGSEKSEGFSTRFMWRKSGAFELYAYLPTGVDTKYGESFVVPKFQFVPGKTYTLSQKIVLNTVGQNNGVFEIFIDGVSVLKKENLSFRLTEDIQIDSLLFATFFGGNDPSFAAKKDESIFFGDFKITDE